MSSSLMTSCSFIYYLPQLSVEHAVTCYHKSSSKHLYRRPTPYVPTPSLICPHSITHMSPLHHSSLAPNIRLYHLFHQIIPPSHSPISQHSAILSIQYFTNNILSVSITSYTTLYASHLYHFFHNNLPGVYIICLTTIYKASLSLISQQSDVYLTSFTTIYQASLPLNNNNNNALYFYTHIQSTTLFKGVYNV